MTELESFPQAEAPNVRKRVDWLWAQFDLAKLRESEQTPSGNAIVFKLLDRIYFSIYYVVLQKLNKDEKIKLLEVRTQAKTDYERLKKLVEETSKVRRGYHDPPIIINVPNIVEHLDDFEMQLRELSQRI